MSIQTDLISLRSREPPACKRCGASHIKKDGLYRKQKRKQTYKCKRCGCKFVFNQSDLEKMRFHSKVISFAVDLYTNTGIALRTLLRKLREYFGIKVSHETIRLWVKKASKHIYVPRISDLETRFWCVDETKIRVNGKFVMLWVVLDPENKVVLAWHVSKGWSLADGCTILKKALQRTGNVPWQIITDHLPLYKRAIRKVFYRYSGPEHYQDTLRRNNPVERLFREVKRRTKWHSTFRSYETLDDFFNVFFYCYNHNKYHRTIGRIPLEQKTIQQAFKEVGLKTLPT